MSGPKIGPLAKLATTGPLVKPAMKTDEQAKPATATELAKPTAITGN